jgi:hypothetical protein
MSNTKRTRLILSLGLLLSLSSIHAHGQTPDPNLLDPGTAMVQDGVSWYSILPLGIEGQGWTDVEQPFDRLPARAHGVVRDAVWGLSHHSAGLCVRFVTAARKIDSRWTLRNENLAMPHMPATGVSGLDLYARADDGTWRWVANGRPEKVPTNQVTLLADIPEGSHEYLLYLPLYNGVTSVEIGIPQDATLARGPARPADKARPVVVWGTSIVQGGCAARPGMVYTAILGRGLDRPVINLGFSGNGKMEPEMANLIAEVDAAAFVLDCAPNCTPDELAERTEPVVRALREKHPETPIVLVENIIYQRSWFLGSGQGGHVDKNAALRAAYERLTAAGTPGLYYVPCDDLLGDDFEATVDGTHATDLGFQRMADVLTPVLMEVIK